MGSPARSAESRDFVLFPFCFHDYSYPVFLSHYHHHRHHHQISITRLSFSSFPSSFNLIHNFGTPRPGFTHLRINTLLHKTTLSPTPLQPPPCQTPLLSPENPHRQIHLSLRFLRIPITDRRSANTAETTTRIRGRPVMFKRQIRADVPFGNVISKCHWIERGSVGVQDAGWWEECPCC